MNRKIQFCFLCILSASAHAAMAQVSQEEELDRQFRGFVIKGDMEAVKMLMTEGVDINKEFWIGGTGLTPVLLAARVGKPAILKHFMDSGAELTAIPDGLNVLHTAVAFEDDEKAKVMAEMLISKGMDVNERSLDRTLGDETPLHIAARNGNLKTADLLLRHGANVNASLKEKYYAYTPLILASKGKYVTVVNLLLQNGADIDAQDFPYLRTPLHYAVMNNDTAVVDLLLSNGADLAIKDHNGLTSVNEGEYRGSQEIKALFRKYGIDLE